MKKFSDFKHRLTLREPDMIQDPLTGELSNGFSILGTVWARIEPFRGREPFEDNATLSIMDTEITIRWSPLTERLTQAHSGEHAGVIYTFVSIRHLHLGQRYIQIMAKSGHSNG